MRVRIDRKIIYEMQNFTLISTILPQAFSKASQFFKTLLSNGYVIFYFFRQASSEMYKIDKGGEIMYV